MLFMFHIVNSLLLLIVIVTRVHDMKSCTLDDPNNHVLLIVKEGLGDLGHFVLQSPRAINRCWKGQR